MSKGPLFSTYRQGENRVTASMLAVFERIDLALVERLLGAASGESELQMVSFRNQVSGPASVPDASISAQFNYLFEVKTERDHVQMGQLRGHLRSLGVGGDQRLFVVTPDIDEPKEVAALRDENARIYWISFPELTHAILGALSDPEDGVSEREAFLLRELVRLFEADGLLDVPEDVAIVAAGSAYPFYRRHGLYICQPNRLRKGIARIGFYTAKAIQEEVPAILFRRDSVEISQEAAVAFAGSDDPPERAAGETLVSAIDSGDLGVGWEGQVFLLSAPDDDRTLTLHHPIAHRERGAWTQKQRYVASDILRAEPTTTEELGK